MKVVIILMLFVLPRFASANEIDRLKTNNDVIHFLIKRINAKFRKDYVISDTAINDSAGFGHNTFYKLDFDRNGLTDLVVDGSKLFIVLAKGKSEYQVEYIDRGSLFGNYSTLRKLDSELLLSGKNINKQGGASLLFG